ncbi:keratin-associated protein 13-1 [Tupaia chinensis]|uniref:Keratin-associated protein n=1 Tax=Tupaia chinensis TaxID=246437 RepID=L9K9G3_TUPCH|nr:keratin-associated protein 13-1 [Tupaia chinensis]ELW59440.1 Keratin-associated protein 13-1 [Tupaia chinensis]
MPYNCCSGNFSSRSSGGYLQYPTSCGSYPSNLVLRPNLCSPSSCQLGSSLYRGCQETCFEPTNCETSCEVSSPCQTSCYRPRTPKLCNPCQTTYSGCLDFGSPSCRSLSYGSRSCYSQSCGSNSFRPLGYGVCGFPSVSYGSRFCRPAYLASGSCQSSCYRPVFGSGFCGSSY